MSIVISIIALVVSISSLSLSAYLAFRDRGRIRTKSTYYPAHEDRGAILRIEAVNIGRRPVILTLFGGLYENSHWNGVYIGETHIGHRLGENEKFTEDIDIRHHMLFDDKMESAVSEFWFEDTQGRRYPVKDSKKHLKRFFDENWG